MFKRGYKAENVQILVKPVEKFRKTIWPPPYDKLNVGIDFICDSPWEIEEDKIDTIKLALRLLPQYSSYFYTLVYLPGTSLYYEAIKQGWIKDSYKDIFMRGIAGIDDNIYNRILFLIAITKERSITLSEKFIDNILEVYKRNEDTAKEIADAIVNNYFDQFTKLQEKFHAIKEKEQNEQ